MEYSQIVEHYEACLERHGDSHRGVDWPNARDAETRYRVMLDMILPHDRPVSVLDFGCGASHLLEYIQRSERDDINYSGLDISPKFIAVSRRKFPGIQYYCQDVLQEEGELPEFDYVVMNGVFTEKRSLAFEEMLTYLKRLLLRVFPLARIGVAFNVMSKHVDWEREDLFHLPFDTLAQFLKRSISRHFVLRADYRLYEYTAYVYRNIA